MECSPAMQTIAISQQRRSYPQLESKHQYSFDFQQLLVLEAVRILRGMLMALLPASIPMKAILVRTSLHSWSSKFLRLSNLGHDVPLDLGERWDI